MDTDALRAALAHERYPRANAYDPNWVIENQMGPNALWLVEALTQVMTIEPGMKVLDLGCGRAMTSIFLAREFGARVWATDLWIAAQENCARIEEAGVADLVEAVHAEAHALPFAPESFDAVVSIDAYHYFGTDDLYIGSIASYLREGGRIGIVVPALLREFDGTPPPEIAPWWDWQFCSLHGPAWWRQHWEKTGRVRVDRADLLEQGGRDWLRWQRFVQPYCDGPLRDMFQRDLDMLEADQGRNLGFSRVVATRI